MGMELLEGLNSQQQAAARADDGAVLIVAGPGTGKTKTLVARIIFLLEQKKAKPGQILALTFTKKAAEEMASRVAQNRSGTQPRITTFHALCHELLQRDVPFVAEAERLQIIRDLPRPQSLRPLSVRELGLAISRAKNMPKIDDPELAKVVKAYNKALGQAGVQDFDDLLLGAYQLLAQDEQVRIAAQHRYRYVLVDEFQDTNLLQYEILKLLLGHNNVFVIGDPNQSIYGFRGASGGIFEQFAADFAAAQTIVLDTNYRSVPEVVHLSNALFSAAPPLAAHNQSQGVVRQVEVLNEYSEAAWVLNEIQRAIGGGDMLRAVSDDNRLHHRRLSDFAVLYRSRMAAVVLQRQLADSGLPYQVVGEGSPYEQPQVQALIALMRQAVSGEPLVLQGFGSAQRRLLKDELADANQAIPSVLVERLTAILGFEPNLALQQFAGVVVRFKTVKDVLGYIDGIAQQGFYDTAADAITLLTIHSSKGLEFPVVFVVGCEEGILPSARGEEAEERRLLYVAVTRAREQLQLLHTKNRGGQKAQRSRFLDNIPMNLLPRIVDPDMDNQLRRIAKRVAKNSQQSLF